MGWVRGRAEHKQQEQPRSSAVSIIHTPDGFFSCLFFSIFKIVCEYVWQRDIVLGGGGTTETKWGKYPKVPPQVWFTREAAKIFAIPR